MKRVLIIFLSTMCITIMVLALFFYYAIPRQYITIAIPYGSTAFDTARILRNAGLIASRTAFIAYLRLTHSLNRIKAGTYKISTAALFPSIANILIRGKSSLVRLTIPEGLTIDQTADILAAYGFKDIDRFKTAAYEKNAEGYLMPETYMVSPDISAVAIFDIMTAQFERTFSSVWDAQAAALGFSRNQIVILASLIEKEVKIDIERPLISAVFHNRLKARKQLESCASIQYALGSWKKRLSLKDLQIPSPYNTYIHRGLPPGPICSPGMKSLEAALFPAQKNLLFFVANGDGTHNFYTTYSDHLKAKEEYKKMIKEYNKRRKGRPYE